MRWSLKTAFNLLHFQTFLEITFTYSQHNSITQCLSRPLLFADHCHIIYVTKYCVHSNMLVTVQCLTLPDLAWSSLGKAFNSPSL